MYAYAKEKTKPPISSHTAAPSEDEILEQLRMSNFPKDDLKKILDKIKQLNPKLKQPHLLVGKYRSGATAGANSNASAAPSRSVKPAPAAASEKFPDATTVARDARKQFEVGENPAPFAPGIDIKRVIKTLSKKGNAIAIMNQAAEEARSSGMDSYFRGTKHRPVLDAIEPGMLVSANFLMSVTQDKNMAERFAAGKYNTSSDSDELGVIYDIIGNPKEFKYGDVAEQESIFPVGAKFKYMGRSGTTYRFVEQSPAEVKKYKGDIYRLYR